LIVTVKRILFLKKEARNAIVVHTGSHIWLQRWLQSSRGSRMAVADIANATFFRTIEDCSGNFVEVFASGF
jgi:hypothetical protein